MHAQRTETSHLYLKIALIPVAFGVYTPSKGTPWQAQLDLPYFQELVIVKSFIVMLKQNPTHPPLRTKMDGK